MSIHIDSCAERDTILVKTRFSTYEVIVLRGDGDVLVRGGRHFTRVPACPVPRVDRTRWFVPATHIRHRSSHEICGGGWALRHLGRRVALPASRQCRLAGVWAA